MSVLVAHPWLLLIPAVLLVVPLLWWFVRRTSAPRKAHWYDSEQAGAARLSTGASRRSPSQSARGRSPLARDAADGPPTILSYLHHDDSSMLPSGFDSSLPSVISEEFAPSTRPQTWSKRDEPPRPVRWADTMPPPPGEVDPVRAASIKKVNHVLNALRDTPAEKAWEVLRGYKPEPAHLDACLETLERIASSFEREERYTLARDVYAHMADLQPDWRQVKVKLMRARGLAQSAAAGNWSAKPSQTIPDIQQRRLGKYLVIKQIGRGAMGSVYLGVDPATGQQVALKTMSLIREFEGNDLIDARARFLREAEMAGRLQHPDIVRIIDAGESDGLAFIAMELVDGQDLSEFTQPGHLMPLEQLLPVMSRVADALDYAHSRGVTHRDIKPANIMVDAAHDSVKVMDFGVARVADATRTRTGVILGTPTFMSPEQLSGQTLDGRTDLYSLGVTLFQLLTGQLPYRNDSMAELMRAIGQEAAPNVCTLRPELPSALGDIVGLALQKHPGTRYASGRQMADDLRAVIQAMWPTSTLDISLD